MLEGALFGAGNIARHGHLRALTSEPDLADGLRITSCCDLAPENLEAVRSAWPGIRTYRGAEALWTSESPNFVDICTPPAAHAEVIRAAAARNVHIFCEKPLCETPREAERLERVLEGRRLVFMAGHQYHFAPPWRAVVDEVRRGTIGEVRFVEWRVWRTEANPGNPHWRPAWRTDAAAAGGGILMDHGVHVAYQLRSLLGDPERVTARLQNLRTAGYAVEDTATVIFEYPHAVARIGFTWAAPARRIETHLVGTKGEIRMMDDRIALLRDGTERVITFDAGLSADSSHAEWYVPLFREFLARITRGDYSTDAWEEARAALDTLDACYRSHTEGRTVTPARHVHATA